MSRYIIRRLLILPAPRFGQTVPRGAAPPLSGAGPGGGRPASESAAR